MSRREQIESMLADSPQDTFLRYALAMELAGDDEMADRCLELHDGLMKDEPPYVPSFFMAGQQLVRLGRDDEAKEILTAGIAQADTQGDTHAAGEMREFLASI
jgi:GH15 family glucan-1,4-alpha-glucosidase